MGSIGSIGSDGSDGSDDLGDPGSTGSPGSSGENVVFWGDLDSECSKDPNGENDSKSGSESSKLGLSLAFKSSWSGESEESSVAFFLFEVGDCSLSMSL